MSKAATLKDVLYGLEFAGAQLCRWPTSGPLNKSAWSLEPGGVKVPGHVADKARECGHIVASALSKHGESRFVWEA